MRTAKHAGPDLGSERDDAAFRRCDYPQCRDAGMYRAPRAREALNQYYWFCLAHVRAYNKAWNFYDGMTADEVEAFIRNDTVGWRPTWPFGMRGGVSRDGRFTIFDRFGLFGGGERRAGKHRGRESRPRWPDDSPQQKALAVFELDPPVTLAEVKRRYKELVKRHHPDANGGDVSAEDELKRINEAYRVLKRFF